jgi:hypothetical protein
MARTRVKLEKWDEATTAAKNARYDELNIKAKNGKLSDAERTELEALTPQIMLRVKKAKGEKRKAERKADLIAVLNYVIENGEEEFKAKARKLLPGQRVASEGGSRVNLIDDLRTLFKDGAIGTVLTEDQIWSAKKWSFADTRKSVLKALKKASPDARLWIALDGEKRTSTLVAIGAKPPKGWMGWVPVDALTE